MVKKKYKKTAGHYFYNGSSLGNQYSLFPQGTNNWKLNTSGAPTKQDTQNLINSSKGSGDDSSSGGNFMSKASAISGMAGMFDSLAQGVTVGIDAQRAGVNNQPQVLVEGVLGGQSGSHLSNMWNTGAKTAEAINYVNQQGNVNFAGSSTEDLLAQHAGVGSMNRLNIDTKAKELEDFAFDPASYILTRWVFKNREKASDRQKRINEAIDAVNARQQSAYNDAVRNFENRVDRQIAMNYRAFGGPLFDMPNFGGGAIDYDLYKDRMNNDVMKKALAQKDASYSTLSMYKDGGKLFSPNFDLGISLINNGGSHEENPMGGVMFGMAPDGKPNFVEEGESIFKDYVFSKRLPVPKAIRNKYKMRGTTFSDVFKEYIKKNGIEERENDPIAQNGLMAFASDLMVSQEMVKAKKEKNNSSHMAAYGGPIKGDTDNPIYKHWSAVYKDDPEKLIQVLEYQSREKKATAEALANNETSGMTERTANRRLDNVSFKVLEDRDSREHRRLQELREAQQLDRLVEGIRTSQHTKSLGGHLFGDGSKIIHDNSGKDRQYFDSIYAKDSDYMKALNWYNDAANAAARTALIADINAGKYDTDTRKINGYTVNDSNWYNLATDYLWGPVHNAIIANMGKLPIGQTKAQEVAAVNDPAPAAGVAVPEVKEQFAYPIPNDGMVHMPDGSSLTPEEYQRIFGVEPPAVGNRGDWMGTDGAWTPEELARVAGGTLEPDGSIRVVGTPGSITGTDLVAGASAGIGAGVAGNGTGKGNGEGNGAMDVVSQWSALGNKYRNAGLFANAAGLIYNLADRYRPRELNEVSPFMPVAFTPIGEYAPEAHFDINYAANQQAQMAAATRNAIMNTTAPNRYATLLAADYDALVANGDLRRKASIDAYDNLLKTLSFNRDTSKYNSTGALDAAKANMSGRQAHDQLALQQGQYNVSNYDSYKRGRDQAIGQGIQSVANWFSDYGKEQNNLAMVGALLESGALSSNEAMDLLYGYLGGPSLTRKSGKKKGGD